MTTSAERSQLTQVPVDLIDPNPDNPRIHFRQRELDDLIDSIADYGIQVPISVYRNGKRFTLIDGERRWRCAIKLNMATIPALIQDPPDRLTNILLMFNIHALREQWDLLTVALKLDETIDLLEEKLGKKATERELARATGLPISTIRRSRLLLNLPKKYQQMILHELEKPKAKQRLTEDFFIEMERALKTVSRAMPDAIDDIDEVRDVLIAKFEREVIENRVHFRNMARIARAENVNADTDVARHALTRLFADNDVSVDDAYRSSVEEAYSGRDVMTRLEGLTERLSLLDKRDINDELRAKLRSLIEEASRLIAGPS